MGLKHVEKRVVIKVDLEGKNFHTFENGTTIRLEREYNNLNQREVRPVNAIVVSADFIPEGSEILIHHNSTHESNRIYDYGGLSGDVEVDSVKYFSIPEESCYAWRDKDGELKPLKNFAFALRVFKPYLGMLEGVDHELVKDVLYITTGELAGNVCGVLKASDYEVVFQGINGREDRIIRIRHSDEEEIEREEVIFIHHELTEKVNKGELYIGLSTKDCQPIKSHHYEIKSYAT